MRKKLQQVFTITAISFCLFFSCTKRKAIHPSTPQTDNPIVGCDTVHVSYACSVKPILQNNCYSCHSTAVTSSGGLDLENFQSLKNYLKLYYHNDSIYGSKFYNIILQTPGSLSMPPTFKLAKQDLSLIKKWLSSGAPEN